MVAGFYRPHHLQSGLKEKKQPVRKLHLTELQGKARNHGIGSTYIVSISFCRKRQSMCSCRRPLHPLRTAKSPMSQQEQSEHHFSTCQHQPKDVSIQRSVARQSLALATPATGRKADFHTKWVLVFQMRCVLTRVLVQYK